MAPLAGTSVPIRSRHAVVGFTQRTGEIAALRTLDSSLCSALFLASAYGQTTDMVGRLDGSGWRHRAFSWPAGAVDIPLGCRRRRDTAVLPGDELVAADLPRTTRALTIDAPVEMVWPWLAQIGEDRGGFYSYSWLEKAAGAHIHNANTIHLRVAEHPRRRHGMAGASIWRTGSAGGRGGQAEIALGADVT